MADSLLPVQAEALARMVNLYESGERRLLVEGETGVGKTRIALEFIKYFWAKNGRMKCLVIVPRRVLISNPWEKEIDKWMANVRPKVGRVTGELSPRLREIFYKSFDGDIILTTAASFHNDLLLNRVKMNSFGMLVFDEVHNVVKHPEEADKYVFSIIYRSMVIRLSANRWTVIGLTIPGTKRTVETEKHLNAVGLPLQSKAPKTISYLVKVDSGSATKLDLFFKTNMYRAKRKLERILGTRLPWMIDEERLEELLRELGMTRKRN